MAPNEFFYTDDEGKKQDAALHNEMLDDYEADLYARLMSFHDVVIYEEEFSIAEALSMFGLGLDDLDTQVNGDVIRFRDGIGRSSVQVK